jgi:hypothetical protein
MRSQCEDNPPHGHGCGPTVPKSGKRHGLAAEASCGLQPGSYARVTRKYFCPWRCRLLFPFLLDYFLLFICLFVYICGVLARCLLAKIATPMMLNIL